MAFQPRKIILRCRNKREAKFGANQSHLYSGRFCLFPDVFSLKYEPQVVYTKLDVYRRSLTFCAISDGIPVIHGRAETTISMLPCFPSLFPAGNSQEISSETNCKYGLMLTIVCKRGPQMVMHFTTSPTSRLQTLPTFRKVHVIYYLTLQLGIFRNIRETLTPS